MRNLNKRNIVGLVHARTFSTLWLYLDPHAYHWNADVLFPAQCETKDNNSWHWFTNPIKEL
jgi:hypothetical protein